MDRNNVKVEYDCPTCNEPLESLARTCGQWRRCPCCSNQFQVPAQSGMVAVAAPVAKPAAVITPEVVGLPKEKKKKKGTVPLSLTMPQNLGGVQTTVSQGTANSVVKVLTGAFCVVLGVIVAMMCGGRRPTA